MSKFGRKNEELFDITRSEIDRLKVNLKKVESDARKLLAQIDSVKPILENSKSTKENPNLDDYYDISEQLVSRVASFFGSDAIKEVGNVVADVMTQNVNGNGECDEFRR